MPHSLQENLRTVQSTDTQENAYREKACVVQCAGMLTTEGTNGLLLAGATDGPNNTTATTNTHSVYRGCALCECFQDD